jgi:hypothetical protein
MVCWGGFMSSISSYSIDDLMMIVEGWREMIK